VLLVVVWFVCKRDHICTINWYWFILKGNRVCIDVVFPCVFCCNGMTEFLIFGIWYIC